MLIKMDVIIVSQHQKYKELLAIRNIHRREGTICLS